MVTWRNSAAGRFGIGALIAFLPLLAAYAQTANTCIDCHGALDPPLQVTAEQFSHDIHAQKGLTCASCHGGDPTKADMDAMSKAAGFRGKIEKAQVPALCARCHADGAFMRQYNPSLRTDQFSQYQTSVHGKLLAKGNTKVAVCTDCHGVHDLRAPADAASKVHPLNIANTCAHCHANAEYMKEFKIPTDQFAKYSGSVHHEAMVVRGDLSAPSCTTCHGNHGAAPPGLSTVQNVCSTCHVFQAQLYDKSPHKKAFDAAALPGCVVCHSNHGIAHPTDAKVGTEAQSVCMDCHVAGDAGSQAAAQIHTELTNLSAAINDADQLLTVAESSGMEVSDARLQQDQARDALTKARVSVHSFHAETLNAEVQAGLRISAKNLQAGKDALAERDYRRRGLMVALIFIFITVAALYFYIRQIEREPAKT